MGWVTTTYWLWGLFQNRFLDLPPKEQISVLKVKVTQSCRTLCDPMDYTVHGILYAKILE